MYGNIWSILMVICAVWVIYDVYTNQKKMNTETKILWTALAVVLSVITAIIYYFIHKK